MRLHLVIASLLVAALAGCTAGLPADVAKLGYVNRDQKFAMDVPAGWTVREQNGLPQVFVVGPEGASGVRPNVVVAVEPAGTKSLDDWAAANRKLLETLEKFELVSEETRDLADGRKARVWTFRHSLLGKSVMQRQMAVLAGGNVCIVTATGSPDTFAAHEKSFEIMSRSFRAGW